MEYIVTDNDNMILTKDDIKRITQDITPEEAQYVMDIKSTLTDTHAVEKTADDIIFLAKLLAFEKKFREAEQTPDNMDYKRELQNFGWILLDYVNNMSQIIQSIIGEIEGSTLSDVALPVSNNPLELINEVKILVQNWIVKHKDDKEYIGSNAKSSEFLANVHKYIYTFRLAKVSTTKYVESEECPNPESPVILF